VVLAAHIGFVDSPFHRGIRAVPAQRLIEDAEHMRSLPSPMATIA
jgi:hypothetical protein